MKQLQYPADKEEITEIIRKRRFEENEGIIESVKDIIENVKNSGDKALIDYTNKFDNR